MLEEEGLRSVWFPAEAAHDLGQQIIVAESDGVVRQGRAVSTGTTRGGIDPVQAAPVLREAVASDPHRTLPLRTWPTW